MGGDQNRDATGISGVSLGGRIALQIGLSHPEAFSALPLIIARASRLPAAHCIDALP